MPSVSARDLERAVKAGEISCVYYLYGQDAYSVQKYKKELVERLVKKGDEAYNLHELQGKDFDADAFSDICDAYPMFADRLCVTVCDLDFDAKEIGDSKAKFIIETIKNLPETTTVIFYTDTVDICKGKKFPSPKNKKLIDAVSKTGTVCEFSVKTKSDTVKDICALTEKKGFTIDRNTAGLLCDRCSSDFLMIANELEKLCCYADETGTKKLTEDMVTMLTPETSEAQGYYLADAVAAGNMSRAMELLDKLTAQRNDPIYLLSIISGSMNDLYRARIALDNSKSAADVKNDFSYAKNIGFRMDNAFKAVRRLSPSQLRRCMSILAETDLKLKTGGSDASRIVMLEEAIVKMIKG